VNEFHLLIVARADKKAAALSPPPHRLLIIIVPPVDILCFFLHGNQNSLTGIIQVFQPDPNLNDQLAALIFRKFSGKKSNANQRKHFYSSFRR